MVITHGLTEPYGNLAAVDGVDPGVEAGQVYGFQGPNGAGKTAALKVLVGTTSGHVRVLGGHPGEPEALRRIGSLIEAPGFYPYLTGRANLRLLARCAPERGRTVMAKLYRPTATSRLAGRILTRLLRAGRGPGFMRLLTVVGRRSGCRYTTPVVPVVTAHGRWLVSPYGEVNWVRNARAVGAITLSRGRLVETLTAIELDARQAAPVLRAYLAMKPAGRSIRAYFDTTPDSSDDEIIRDAPHHPVFELTQQPAGSWSTRDAS